MLYGSYARGTADADSDVDVLQIVGRAPQSYSRGAINVTSYTPRHIRQMSSSGSLFILHLLTEGRVLFDPRRTLLRALQAYRPPFDYSHYKAELAIAAAALDASSEDISAYLPALARLGIYLVRTAAYISCIEVGVTTFNLDEVIRRLSNPLVTQALGLRDVKREYRPEDLELMRNCLHSLIPDVRTNEYGSLAGLAVGISNDWNHAANLVSGVIAGNANIDYAAALPPM